MKLLLDENLSPRLAGALADLFPGSSHVHDCGLDRSSDDDIWNFAKSYDFTIVSRDSDFVEMSALRGSPPKVIWLQMGNCTTKEIEEVLRRFAVATAEFIRHPVDRCLVLKRQSFARRRKT